MDTALNTIDNLLILPPNCKAEESNAKNIDSSLKNVTHTESLDSYLDDLEKKYELGKYSPKVSVEEPSRQEIARQIKKRNKAYRTVAKILRELQENSKVEKKHDRKNTNYSKICNDEDADTDNGKNEEIMRFFGIPLVIQDKKSSHYFYQNMPQRQ